MEREKEILAFWKEKGIFEKTLSSRAKGKPFVFYDGPPFATGLPHYGHILAGTVKDAIPRYQTMRGRHVRRKWGWDCHGLPLENIVEQELGLKHKKDIEAFGIEQFNETAKKAVLRYERDWKEIVPRTGRFVEMEHPYKTMDASYTESVWWSWKTLWDKKLAYEGYKIMYVCPRCETPLAQSEVAGSYQDVTDLSVTAKFELLDMPGTYLLAWTTTPWTLPGNTALAVNPNLEYAHIELREPGRGGKYIVGKERLASLNVGHAVLSTFKGKDLVGRSYKPLFDYYAKGNIKNRQNGWKIYPADFVTTESGTGIVHIAPAFGEDDMNLCNKFELPFVQHVGMDGRMKDEAADFKGLYVKQKGDTQSTDVEVLKYLAAHGLLFAKEKVAHSYPLCWRCDTPLLNYATSSWFVKVSAFKDKLVRENRKVTWVPAHLKEGRFGKWLEGAKDWAVSRSRFWGAPLPVWRCAACTKLEVMGSLAELQSKFQKNRNRYFVMRHGHAESNGAGALDSEGNPANHLTEKGKEEARKAAKLLKSKKINRIITSPLIRARETAEIIGAALGVPVSVDERFREIRFGEYDGKPVRGYEAFFSTHDHFTEAPPGAETHNALKRRVMEALSELETKHKNEHILIVTHESGAWMLKVGTRGFSPSEGRKFWDDNAGNRKEILKNGEVQELSYAPFPHNREWELDYHRPYVDDMRYPCACGGEMRRIEDVFDCWYESGSMPYGQFHYPFEDAKLFKQNFPADFIAEGLDQTRGWFYSLTVLGVALFGEIPFKHVIVNGIILAEDGQKMSKKLKNYPDPMELVDKYGADALRYYLLSSPVVRGEDINFSEKAVAEVSRKVIGRLMNVHSFYETYQSELASAESWKKTKNPLDIWILSRLAELRNGMTEGMERYELDAASRGIDKFVDDLSTWYLRRSRERFKGDDVKDREWALATTHRVLFDLSKLLAPFMPFIAEDLYQKVKGIKDKESVHLESWPEEIRVDKDLIDDMEEARRIVSSGLEARAKNNIKVRQPLLGIEVSTVRLSDKKSILSLIKDELNVKEITTKLIKEEGSGSFRLNLEITPELKKEGQLRDLTRTIQELRKEKKLTPRDRITLVIDGNEEGKDFVREFEAQLKKAVLADALKFEAGEGEEVEIGDLKLIIAIEK